MLLFEFYLESRGATFNYEKLVDLQIYDRVKSSLLLYLAHHVLALEAAHKDGWSGRLELANALDAYMANVQGDSRPRVPVPQPKVSLALDRGKRSPDTARQAVSRTELVTVQDLHRHHHNRV